MINRKRKLNSVLATAIGLVAWAASDVAFAQVDYRVNYRQNSNGRLFNANNRLGSGGINPQSQSSFPYGYDYGVYSNRVVSGNVTGFSGFRGASPIPGVNQFRVGLQSDMLAPFRARSVSIDQVRSGSTLRSTTYYDPATSIADAGAIRYGLNQPGSSVLSSPSVRLPQVSVQGVRDQLLGIDRTFAATHVGQTDFGTDPIDLGRTTQRPIVTDARNRVEFPTSYPVDPYQSAMQSTLFGTPELNRDPLLSSARSPQDRPLDSRLSTSLSRDELMGLVDRRGTIDEGVNDGQASSTLTADSASPTAPFDALVQGIGRSDRAVIPQEDTGAASGDELFNRMIEAVQQIESAGRIEGFMRRRNEDAKAERDPMSSLIVGSPDRQTPASAPPMADDARQPTRDSDVNDNASELPEGIASPEFNPRDEWAKLFMQTPIRTFSLGGKSRVGQYMRSAEEALKKGEFNRASRLFDLAATVDPGNPLPLLGRGHAQIASGRYVSAVASLEAGLRQFPQIAAFELDLPSLTGQTDVFDRRRADLESILEKREQYELRFLLGYVELYSNLHFDGLNDLERAARNAPAGSIIRDFPDLLMGRKTLEPTER